MATHNIGDVKIQLRRDTATNWSTENPTLLAGEIGIETDTLKAKVGDGSTAWNSLSYAFGISGGGGSGTYLPLSGGTMTGDIAFSAREGRIQKADNNYDGQLSVFGSNNYQNGAWLMMYGKNNASYGGHFRLAAMDDTNGRKELQGKPDGTLTWDGTAISLNGHTHSYLPLTGGTLTGNVTMSKSAPIFSLNDTVIARNTAPSENYAQVEIESLDKNSNRTWGLYHRYNTDKTNRIDLIAYNGTTTNYNWTGIGAGFDGSGNAFTYAPTPAQTDDSTNIATTAYVKDCVPKSIGSATNPVYTNSDGVVTACTYTLEKSVPSNAVFTDTNNAVTSTAITPTSATSYYITGSTSSSTATGGLSKSAYTRFVKLTGTASAEGYDRIYLGNTTATGTAGNSTGGLLMYGTKGKYAFITPHSNDTADRTIYTPKSGGTLVVHTTDNAIGSATQPVYVSASGVATECTYTLGKSVPSNAVFTDHTYSNFVKSGSTAAAGLVPKPSTTAGTTKYLREDCTWQVPPNTNNISATGTGYIRFNNSRQICWGTTTVTGGQAQVTFPAAFSAKPTFVFGGSSSSSSFSSLSATKVNINSSNSSDTVYWVALGSWSSS